jgi:hypothetical protein
MFKTALLLVICLACFIACKKENQPIKPPTIEYILDPEGLKYIQLRLGQYFIYKDSASGLTDSVVVMESTLKKEGEGVTWEGIDREIFSLRLASKDSTWVESLAIAYTDKGDFTLGAYKMYFSYQPRCISCASSAVYKLPSLTVEGVTYKNVMVWDDITNDRSYGCAYYWAPLTGLIKTVEQTSTMRKTYTLLRHN